MGGIGSGTWYRSNSKDSTDQHCTLDVNTLARNGLLRQGAVGRLHWCDGGSGTKLASISFSIVSNSSGDRVLRIRYRLNDQENVSTTIPLESTVPHFTGSRWWFTCPMSFRGVTCDRRVVKLYLREGEFGCRHCHDLTYRSCQESHRMKRLFDRLSVMVGSPYRGELEEHRSTLANYQNGRRRTGPA